MIVVQRTITGTMHENIKIDRAVKYTEKDGKHIFKNTLV